jgi:two-component system, cell cycle sensor histidine kinase and response regulator CckA
MKKIESISPLQLLTGVTTASVFPFLAGAVFKSHLYTVMDISSYLVFHNVAEFFSVMVSFSIFALGWNACEQNRDRHALFLSVAFLAIGLIDFMHTLGYSGMPPLITPNVTNKATEFWIAARFLGAATFLASAFIPTASTNRWLSKTVLMTAAVALSSVVFIAVIYFPDYLPAAFVDGAGLTTFKITSEYVIITLLVIAAILYWRRLSKSDDKMIHYYLAAFVLCIFSELAFTLYKSAFDTYNMLGHVYKVIAFGMIYKGIFVASVRKPYESLAVSNAELLQNRNMLSHIINTIPQAIFWKDRNCRYLGCNRLLARQAGLEKPENIVGLSDFDLPWSREETEGYRADDKQVMDSGEGKIHIIETQRQLDGSVIWIDTTKMPLVDSSGKIYGVMGVFDDITTQKQAHEALERSEKRHRSILQTALSGYWLTDMQGRLLEVNESYCRMSGYSEQELLTMSISDIDVMEGEGDTSTHIQKIITLGGDRFESRHRRKDGSVFDVEVSTTFQAMEGGRFVAFLRDISQNRKLEEQLRQSQKMEALGLLAGGIAHDFNNILTVIMGYCSLLNMTPHTDPIEKEAIEHINSSAERAAQLTRGLLAFSHKQVMDPKPMYLNDVVQQVQKFLIRIIGEDITLKSIFSDATLKVMADAGQIEQVLMNLATNARDAMPEGGTLAIETGSQELDAAFVASYGYGTPGRYAVVSVSDSGIGMNEETRNKIFEPFFTTKDVGKGTGLGMAIVHGIVTQHGGFVHVYSEPENGTTFKIYIPLLDKNEVFDVTKAVAAPPKGGSETILVVEDDSAIRRLVETLLVCSGYEVILAENGEDGVNKFAADSSRIKLIIMDMIMPKKSGIEAYREMKPALGEVKVLFTSGYTDDFIRSRGDLDEGTDLIMKPLKPTDLLRMVREMLDR